jgi:tRNA pseudouridine-54 N-methylase
VSWVRMPMRRFLILFNDLLIDKASVKAGTNSSEIVTACRCINIGLFLSGNMRRDVTVTIAVGTPKDMTTITFPGDTLKRVSPDERSISFFLLKSLGVADGFLENSQRVLDNGILIAREGFERLVSTYAPQRVFLAQKECKSDFGTLDQSKDALFIYNTGMLIDSVEEPYSALSYPPHAERFILDINEWYDKENET